MVKAYVKKHFTNKAFAHEFESCQTFLARTLSLSRSHYFFKLSLWSYPCTLSSIVSSSHRKNDQFLPRIRKIMRFKATLATEQVSLLYSLVNPMSRLATDGGGSRMMGGGTIMYLSPEVIKISTRGRGSSDSDGMICFSELATQGGIFLDQRVESISDNGKTANGNTVQRPHGCCSLSSF